jgi:hypothetical protein
MVGFCIFGCVKTREMGRIEGKPSRLFRGKSHPPFAKGGDGLLGKKKCALMVFGRETTNAHYIRVFYAGLVYFFFLTRSTTSTMMITAPMMPITSARVELVFSISTGAGVVVTVFTTVTGGATTAKLPAGPV